MASAVLSDRGWHVTEEGFRELSGSKGLDTGKLIQILKDTDLKECGKGWLPEEINRGRCEYVQGPGVLQVQKIRNVAAPKDNEESQFAPRLLKLTLTDGQNTCNGVETEKLDNIGLNTPPGTKICLKGTIGVEHGFLMLNNKNTSCIGGRVDKLAENWELKKMLSKQTRVIVGSEGGPPPFVPFGQRVKESKPQSNKKENFKSLDTGKEKKVEDAEFEQQRQATIAEAIQAKEDGKTKSFGGGQKQVGSDADIARIVEMGFSTSEANIALRQNNGDVRQAINSLLSGGGQRGVDRGGGRDRGGPPGGRDRNQRNGPNIREERRERGGRGRRNDENEDIEAAPATKPSGPATLFDFLETKIKPSSEEKDSGKSSQRQKPLQNSNEYSSQNNYRRNEYNRDYEDKPYRNQNDPPRSSRNDNSRTNRENERNSRPNSNTDGQGSWRKDTEQRRNYNSEVSSGSDRDRNRNSANTQRGQKSSYSDRNSSYSDRGDKYSTDDKKQSQNDNRGRGQRSNYNQQDRSQSARDSYRSNDSDRTKQFTKNDQFSNQDRNNQQSRPRSSQDSRQNNYNDRGYGSQGRNRGNNPDQSDWNSSNKNNNSANSKFNPRAEDFVPTGQMGLQGFDPTCPPPPFNQPPPTNHQQYSYDNQYQQPNIVNFSVPKQEAPMWKRGDRCMAKYWEDSKFYVAVVEGVAPNLPTCVVRFVDYGNVEEVSLSDVKPLQRNMTSRGKHNDGAYSTYDNLGLPQQPYAAPVAMDPQSAEQQIRSMEFRRKRSDQPPREGRPQRNAQQLYQPPRQRPQ